MAGWLIPASFSSQIQVSWNFKNVSKVSLHLAISGCSSPAAFIRRKALYRSRCTGCPPTSFFHRVPYGADDFLCRQGIHIPFPLFLLYGDPAVELVFGQAVFHTEGKKFFFLPFPFPVGVHGSQVPFVLPESSQPFPGMRNALRVHIQGRRFRISGNSMSRMEADSLFRSFKHCAIP